MALRAPVLYWDAMPEFLTVLPPQEARARFAQAYTPRPRGTERVTLRDAYRRVLAVDVIAEERHPVERVRVDVVDPAGLLDANRHRPSVAPRPEIRQCPFAAVAKLSL